MKNIHKIEKLLINLAMCAEKCDAVSARTELEKAEKFIYTALKIETEIQRMLK